MATLWGLQMFVSIQLTSGLRSELWLNCCNIFIFFFSQPFGCIFAAVFWNTVLLNQNTLVSVYGGVHGWLNDCRVAQGLLLWGVPDVFEFSPITVCAAKHFYFDLISPKEQSFINLMFYSNIICVIVFIVPPLTC